ncbi:MAG TPA: flagellar biosynthetic protein FliQ [Verrucomicrobiae bacterium]|jgi:flagellar biosynthetic protein FliQ|nr:flagellar biosynthetic protein FliQ [Verrucomicrobiae bacterium]
MEAFDGLLRETMAVAAALCLPILGVAAIVGLAVAIVQAATQIQEQTLTLLPKVVAIGLTVGLFGAWGMRLLERLFSDAIVAIPQLVRGG